MTASLHEQPGYRKILVATDFSDHAQSALKQAVWLARQNGAKITLVHTLPDLRRAVHTVSYQAKMDLLYGEGSVFEREVRHASDARLQKMVADHHATDLDVTIKTLLGTPYAEIIHATQEDGYDLVLAGTRGWRPGAVLCGEYRQAADSEVSVCGVDRQSRACRAAESGAGRDRLLRSESPGRA